MKIRIEISSLATAHKSGVASYTELLTKALSKDAGVTTYGHYFNFLNRQPRPKNDNSIVIEENVYIPLRIYTKLQSFALALPFDIFLPKVDLTIFPNFATWPTTKSKLRATTIHDLTYLYYPEYVEAKNLSHLQRVVPRSIRKADIILTVSDSVKKELVREFDLDPEKCVVTPVPPDDIFRKHCNKQELETVKTKYKLGTKKYILFLGNFEPRKNLKTLVNAYRLLPAETRNEYQLVLAGGVGWKFEDTQQAIDDAIEAGVDINHIGYIDSADRPALYQAASLFVMPSFYEGFGVPVLEAMASNTPVIAADIPVLREVGANAARYFTPDSPELLAVEINEVLDSKSQQESMKKDGYKQLKNFSWDKNVKEITAMIDRVLKKNTIINR